MYDFSIFYVLHKLQLVLNLKLLSRYSALNSDT